jgi:hypothetical protein
MLASGDLLISMLAMETAPLTPSTAPPVPARHQQIKR